MKSVDISIVLNLHNEGKYLRRTVKSLCDAVYYARRTAGLTFELIIVLDRPDDFIKKIIKEIDFSFAQNQLVFVDNGSLGLSRNAGIAHAAGRYIAFADGDDLISFNYFGVSYATAESCGDVGVFPEYLYAFGGTFHLAHYENSDTFNARAFFDLQPYISRLFIRREILEKYSFVPTPKDSLYAYEDWHLNATLAGDGYKFRVAPNAWLFYRQRSQSIMATTGQQKIIPATPFFKPTRFRETAKPAPLVTPLGVRREEVLSSMVSTELIYAANQIEPAIDIEHLRWSSVWIPPVHHTPRGDAYLEICEKIDQDEFDHVALMPFISAGGAEKYLLNILAEFCRQSNGLARILIVTGESFANMRWPPMPRFQHTLIDVYEIATRHAVSELELTFRLIQATAERAQIHMLSCPFVFKYFLKYKKTHDTQRINLYSFSSSQFEWQGRDFIYGDHFSFISEVGEHVDRVISDNQVALDRIRRTIDLPNAKFELLRSKVMCQSRGGYSRSPEGLGDVRPLRLLWASRLDFEKRPDLLIEIAKLLTARRLPAIVDAYGSSVLGEFDISRFEKIDGLSYLGRFDGLNSLPLASYDAFIYTSLFDGVPNVLLEAMSAGLPVIAPDVGGIREVVRDRETGILLSHSKGLREMAEKYVEIIESILEYKIDLESLSNAAFALLAAQHSPRRFASEVRRIFLNNNVH